MKNFKLNRKYVELGLYILAFLALGLILGKILWNIGGFGQSITDAFKFIQRILSPFIYGLFIAYFMNTTVCYLEAVLFRRIAFFHKRAKLKRLLSVLLTYILYIGCLTWIISYLIPEVIRNTSAIIMRMPTNTQDYLDLLNSQFNVDGIWADILGALQIDLSSTSNIALFLQKTLTPLQESLQDLSNISGWVNEVLARTVNFAGALLNIALSIVISFYMLCDKETYQDLGRKGLTLLFRKRTAERILRVASDSNRIIQKFIIGKVLDSTIIAVMFFTVCLFVRPTYTLLLTIIVGVTNMIPYFGPIVGGVIAVLITLLSDPKLALWILLIIFILQQFDGMYLGPKILGDSTGLSPMHVILAITVGGALFGIGGMFFGVPIFAIIRNLVSAFFNKKYDQKMAQGGAAGHDQGA